MGNSTTSHPKRFVAIDSNSLVHRAFHAFPASLATSSGVQVNAVYGFTSMFLKVISELKPKYLVCAFDRREPSFRKTEYVDYKANRKPVDSTLPPQFDLVKQVLQAFNVPIIDCKGYEADDILGTMSEYCKHGKWKNENLEMIIVTGDKDLLQLVGNGVKVLLPEGSFKNVRIYEEAEVKEKFGFGPEYEIDFKGLVGDTSDNIPGVKGIGDKTALELIEKYGHLEEIYKHLNEVKPRIAKLLTEGIEVAEMSRKLATIVKDAPMDLQLEACLMKDFNRSDVIKVFQEFEFRSLINKIPESINEKKGTQMDLFCTNDTQDDVTVDEPDAKALERLQSSKDLVACYYDSNLYLGTESESFKITNASERVKEIVDLLDKTHEDVIFYGWEDFTRELYCGILSGTQKKELLNISRKKIFDIGLAAYYLSSGRRDYSLHTLLFENASFVMPEEGTIDAILTPVFKAIRNVATRLRAMIEDRMKTTGFERVLGENPIDGDWIKSVDFPLSLTLAEMSKQGILVDTGKLEKKSKELEEQIGDTEKSIFDAIGHEFNISSSRQLADVLYNELQLPTQKRTKTGYSTAEPVLLKLADMHPVVRLILVYRELVKMKSTYVDPLIEYQKNSSDKRIHTTFRQAFTSTGRLSSQDPNLQNIPVRTDLGKEIKGMFISPKGKVLVSADYSQIELRIMAHFSQDKLMIDDFLRGADFHAATAARIFEKPEKDVTSDERRVAKTINFGIMYGLSAFGLSEQLSISREEAANYIAEYFEKYKGIKKYFEESLEFVRKNGYVESLFGRRRNISGVNAKNRMLREASEREALNMPIQGTAADIMRLAMVKVYDWLLKQDGNVAFLLQIHDELVFECGEKDCERVASEVKDIMEHVVKLDVPLICNASIGSNLGEK